MRDRTRERSNLATLVGTMHRWGGGPAVVEHRGLRRFSTSYAELARLAGRFAAELERRGIAPGERVVLWGGAAATLASERNTAHWIAAYFGCVLRGVLAVPLDAAGAIEFAKKIVADVSPRLIVGDRALLAQSDFSAPLLSLEALAQQLPERGSMVPLPALDAETPLQILFTSGTTGQPKGVVHTHGNLLASLNPIEREIARYRRYERWVHPLRILHTLPLSHVFGQLMGLWVPPLLGACVHYEGGGAPLWERIAGERIHVLAAVPRSLALLRGQLLQQFPGLEQQLDASGQEPLARRWWRFRQVHRALGLRFWAAVCGGATLPPELERFWTGMGFALVQGYGLTETAALVTLNHPLRTARGSLGTPLPGRALRLSAAGELEVKGPMVAAANWLGGEMVPRSSPWLRTGDLAELGEDGRVRFLGRTGQRLVTAAGLNVYLQDVEQALEVQPGLHEVLALALPGVDGGDEPAAVLVAPGGAAAAGAAVALANKALQPHQQVRRWYLWPSLALPRGATGKVRRAEVEQWAREQAGSGESAAPDEQDQAGRLLLMAGARPGSVEDSASLESDWGLDSMGRVALGSLLEEAGLVLGEAALDGLQTLGELRAMLANFSRQPFDRRRSDAEIPERRSERGATPPGAASGEETARGLQSGRLQNDQALTGPPLSRWPLIGWPWSWPVAAARRGFQAAVLRPLVALLGRPRVRGAEGLARVRGPLLVIANHRTAVDVPLVLYALPAGLRAGVAVAMSGEMLAGWQSGWRGGRRGSTEAMDAEAPHRRWWGPLAAMLVQGLIGVFPLPRNAGFRRGFRQAGRILDRGGSVLVFPEGRRAPEGPMLPFKPGLGILAREALVPVLPIGLRLERGKRAAIRVGEPLSIDVALSAEQIAAMLQAAVQALLVDE